jgi:hypothetical protein
MLAPSPDHHLHGGPPWVWCNRKPCPTLDEIIASEPQLSRPSPDYPWRQPSLTARLAGWLRRWWNRP